MVWFERVDHPLIERLRAAGVEAGPFDDEPRPSATDEALVADPGSARILDLGRDGAEIAAAGVSVPDSLTAAYAAATLRAGLAGVGELVAIMARLRSDDGCPWDRKQTHQSLKVHLVEEAHEVLDAIDSGDLTAGLEEELGDVLLQVAFHARLAEQEGRFDIGGVGRSIAAKLHRRHPHVFGDVSVSGPDEVVTNWETLKAKEKNRDDPFADIPGSLPALLTAYKSQKRAASLGFTAEAAGARARLEEALDGEVDDTRIGEALFWLVAVARAAGVDPEGALRAAVGRFQRSTAPAPPPSA